MRKITLPLSLVLLGFAALPLNVSAQRYDPRVDIARDFRPNPALREIQDERVRGGRNRRLALEIERLRREVRQVRDEIRITRGVGRQMRYRFDRVLRATEEIDREFRRGENAPRIRRHIDQTRAELFRIQREVRLRRR